MFKLNPNGISMNAAWKEELVLVTIPANQAPQRINFPDVQNLRNVHLCAIDVYTRDEFRQTLNGGGNNDVIDRSILEASFLTLQLYNGKEFIHQTPLQRFNFYNFQSIPTPQFIGQKVNWPKSYIELVPAYAIEVFDRNYVFSIWYAEDREIEINDMTFEFKKKMK